MVNGWMMDGLCSWEKWSGGSPSSWAVCQRSRLWLSQWHLYLSSVLGIRRLLFCVSSAASLLTAQTSQRFHGINGQTWGLTLWSLVPREQPPPADQPSVSPAGNRNQLHGHVRHHQHVWSHSGWPLLALDGHPHPQRAVHPSQPISAQRLLPGQQGEVWVVVLPVQELFTLRLLELWQIHPWNLSHQRL